jgi:hypothetical protein
MDGVSDVSSAFTREHHGLNRRERERETKTR